MSKDEKKATEAKAMDANATPVDEKSVKSRTIFGRKITVEKAAKAKKVKLTKEEKKAKKQEKWENFKAGCKKAAKKAVPVVLLVGGIGIGAIAKTYKDTLTADHPSDDEPEDDTMYQTDFIDESENAETAQAPANEVNAEEKSED